MTEPPVADSGPCVAVVLAGGTPDDPLARRYGVVARAHVPVGGVPLVQRVVAALCASSGVDRIVYVGEPPDVLEGSLDASVPAGERLSDSLALGLGAALALAPARLLLVTADVPWLTPAAVDRFLQQAPPADLVYPVVEAGTMAAQFPGQRRTFVRTGDGRFTGGNLVLLTPRTVPRLLPFLERLARGRKNPLALSAIFGPAVVWGLVRGTLRVADLERRASRLLGLEALALVSGDGALAADVDREDHLAALEGSPPQPDRPEEVSP